jgi:transcriptional regulator with XRE-family HTH domain
MNTIHQLFDLAKIVKAERLSQGLTQSELASASGISRRWLIGLEQGTVDDARFGNVMKVLSTLGIQLHANASRSESPAQFPSSATDILALNPHNQPYANLTSLLGAQVNGSSKGSSALKNLGAQNRNLLARYNEELAKAMRGETENTDG